MARCISLVKHRFLTLISTYALTLNAEKERKNELYEKLDRIITSIGKDDKIILLGDFNARVGMADHLCPKFIGKQKRDGQYEQQWTMATLIMFRAQPNHHKHHLSAKEQV